MASEKLLTFDVEIYQLYSVKQRVQARTAEEALDKVFVQGHGEEVNDSLTYIERADKYGRPLTEMYVPIDVKVLGKGEFAPLLQTDDGITWVEGLRNIEEE